MREKKPTLVVTFHTTAAAIAMEKLCKTQGLAGRLAPVPRALSSDCGIVWICEPSLRKEIEELSGKPEIHQIAELLL